MTTADVQAWATSAMEWTEQKLQQDVGALGRPPEMQSMTVAVVVDLQH